MFQGIKTFKTPKFLGIDILRILRLQYLATAPTASTPTLIDAVFRKNGSSFEGASINHAVIAEGPSGAFQTGTTSGVTIHYSGSPFSNVENKVVALLRSRATVDSDEIVRPQITGSTDIDFNENHRF